MPEGKFAVITAFPQNPLLTGLFMAGMYGLLQDSTSREGFIHFAANEVYSRIGDKSPPSEVTYENMSAPQVSKYLEVNSTKPDLGSSWFISCPDNHRFHTHTKDPEITQLSQRKLLISSDKGMEAQIFSVGDDNQAKSAMEVYKVPAGTMIELSFDGNLAHRFIPNDGGKVVIYGIHPRDQEVGDSALGAHTNMLPHLKVPTQTVIIEVGAEVLSNNMLAEGLRGFDTGRLRAEITNLTEVLDGLDKEAESGTPPPQGFVETLDRVVGPEVEKKGDNYLPEGVVTPGNPPQELGGGNNRTQQ